MGYHKSTLVDKSIVTQKCSDPALLVPLLVFYPWRGNTNVLCQLSCLAPVTQGEGGIVQKEEPSLAIVTVCPRTLTIQGAVTRCKMDAQILRAID